MSKAVLTTGEAARLCGVSQQTIIRCFDNGTIKGYRVPGSRFRRIPRESFLLFLEANNIPVHVAEPWATPTDWPFGEVPAKAAE